MFNNYLLLPLAATTIKNSLTFFSDFRRHTNCNMHAHEFDQRELERYVQVRRSADKKESGIRAHVLIFKGAWSRTNNNIPRPESPKIKMSKFSTEYLTPEQ